MPWRLARTGAAGQGGYERGERRDERGGSGNQIMGQGQLLCCVDLGLRGVTTRNSRGLKRMLADAMLDNVALKDLLGKKW